MGGWMARCIHVTLHLSTLSVTPSHLWTKIRSHHAPAANPISLALDNTEESFNIVDIKPFNMDELTEVITAAEFHPTDCNLFLFSSSKGCIKLIDMRSAALCDAHAKVFEENEDPSKKSFFSEIISSISDACFSRNGRYILSRDYLTLKIWDINMESRPLRTINIHEYLRDKLCDLYETDFIFDKFECVFSGDGKHLLTGGYHNLFHIYDQSGKSDVCVEASKSPPPRKRSHTKSKLGIPRRNREGRKKTEEINVDSIDFTKKILHLGWHPKNNLFAVAALNNLFIYRAL